MNDLRQVSTDLIDWRDFDYAVVQLSATIMFCTICILEVAAMDLCQTQRSHSRPSPWKLLPLMHLSTKAHRHCLDFQSVKYCHADAAAPGQGPIPNMYGVLTRHAAHEPPSKSERKHSDRDHSGQACCFVATHTLFWQLRSWAHTFDQQDSFLSYLWGQAWCRSSMSSAIYLC